MSFLVKTALQRAATGTTSLLPQSARTLLPSTFFGRNLSTTANVVKLLPPLLKPSTLLQKIICTRPMRVGQFNISAALSVKNKAAQQVVHCYGHGGAGYTTLFGSVNHALNIFESTHPDKKIPIRVVGNGCVGRTMAIELYRRGYKVTGITAQESIDLPSWKAAGRFGLASLQTAALEKKRLDTICRDTFLAYKSMEKGLHPYLSREVVQYMPVYCDEGKDAGVEELEKIGLLPPAEKVTLDFMNGVQHDNYIRHMTYFIDTSRLMLELGAELHRLSIPLETRELNSFEECSEAVVFNCSGLGARRLNHDSSLVPVIGHMVALSASAGELPYMISTAVVQDGKKEPIYLIPKKLSITKDAPLGAQTAGFLGGTFIEQRGDGSIDHASVFQKLLDRNHLFFHGRLYTG